MNKPKIFVLIVVSALLLGAIIEVFADPFLPPLFSNSKKAYQAGFNAARTLVENSSFGNFFHATDSHSISGTVISIEGNHLTIHLSFVNPLDDQTLTTRSIFIGTSTSIVKLTPKDPAAFQLEVNAFIRSQSGSTTSNEETQSVSPPAFLTQVGANLEDVEVGDVVTVSAPEVVSSLKEFTASEIQIQPQFMSSSSLPFLQ